MIRLATPNPGAALQPVEHAQLDAVDADEPVILSARPRLVACAGPLLASASDERTQLPATSVAPPFRPPRLVLR